MPGSTRRPTGIQWRWVAIGVFMLSAGLNYLDRQVLAAAAPLLKQEFSLSNVQYGQMISAFSLVYALTTPFAGLLIDRFGLRLSSTLAVAFWSIAGAFTGLASSFQALLACRVALAVGESAGIPSTTKANATYLRSRELGLGTATLSIGSTAGSIAAPLLVAAMAPAFGWRSVFFISGMLGLLWVPLWLFVSKRVPAGEDAGERESVTPVREMLADSRLWGVAVANALVMTLYSLWMNWTTVYFVQERGLTMVQANQQFAWLPPVFATLGGFFGGWLAFRAIRRQPDGVRPRLRICWMIAPVLLLTAAVPLVDSTLLASATMALSFFGCLAIVNNLQMIPIDLFGPKRAALTGSVLTCSYALMQSLVSPAIGRLVDTYGFSVVCIAMSVMPLLGVLVLTVTLRNSVPAPVRSTVPA